MAKPRPKAKTEEPAPAATAPKTGRPAAPAAYDDPALDALTEGLQALQKKDWSKAAELFESALAQSDRSDLSARARQFLASARQHLPVKPASGTASGTAKDDQDGDPFLRAVFEKNRGNLAGALELCRKEGREQKDERFAYLAASIHAVEGRIEEALQALSRAIELNPKNRVHAYHDPDFAEIRRDRENRQLFGLS
jgi:tetratricopeptide (TPR) repeat protein